jgi:hypothetical protein
LPRWILRFELIAHGHRCFNDAFQLIGMFA